MALQICAKGVVFRLGNRRRIAHNDKLMSAVPPCGMEGGYGDTDSRQTRTVHRILSFLLRLHQSEDQFQVEGVSSVLSKGKAVSDRIACFAFRAQYKNARYRCNLLSPSIKQVPQKYPRRKSGRSGSDYPVKSYFEKASPAVHEGEN